MQGKVQIKAVSIGRWNIIICSNGFIIAACFILWHFNNVLPRALLCISSPRHVHNIQSSESAVCWLPLVSADILKHELLDIPKWGQTTKGNISIPILSTCLIMAHYRTISYEDTKALSTWEGCHRYHPANRIQFLAEEPKRLGAIVMQILYIWQREKTKEL